MDIKKMSLEELEQLSYTDIAYEILKISKRPKNTPKLFGEVCKLLKIDENQMMEMIGDFYTSLTTDKRFILLESAKWDLRESHSVKMIIEEEEEEQPEEEEEEQPVDSQVEDDVVDETPEDYDETDEDLDELDDLVVVTEEEMDE